ncbi:hypothetical protein [Pseudomonas yamanorum]|uniref:hypothetical protein n=1 Tax=Pseudomonas yamanorum TaxID=515393 RepID=UPI003B9FE1CB
MKAKSNFSPNSELYILDFSKLEIGDIILTRTDELQSKVIRSVTGGEFSHALLYVADVSCIHATKSGVHSLNVQRLFFESGSDVAVLRLGSEYAVCGETLKNICDYTRKKVAVRYDKGNAIKAGLAKIRPQIKPDDESQLQFCSQLIVEAYLSQNIDITSSGRFSTPADIEQSEILRIVESPARLATFAEKTFGLDESRDKIKIQTTATNFIFKKVRKNVSRSVNTFEELYQCAVNDRDADLKISKILKESKYLDMAKIELQDCPWRYDYDSFKEMQIPLQEQLSLIESELSGAVQQIRKYQSAVSEYENLYGRFKSLSIKCTLAAYRNMLIISHVRYGLFLRLKGEM